MSESALDYLSTFPEVDALTFYKDLFKRMPLQSSGASFDGRYRAIALRINERNEVSKYLVSQSLEELDELIDSKDFCLMPPCSYVGKSMKQKDCAYVYALAFDLDGITHHHEKTALRYLFTRFDSIAFLPRPTYIVASSENNVHLYYLLEEPIRLNPNALKQLNRYRHFLTWKLWNKDVTTEYNAVQYESATQAMRLVGSYCKDKVHRVRAFKVGEPVTLDYMNRAVAPEAQITDVRPHGKITKQEWKAKDPDSYQRRIVEGKPRGYWYTNTAFYDWFQRQIGLYAVEGHRYFCLWALSVIAAKCGVPHEKLIKDALEWVPYLNSIGDNPFTKQDALTATEAYNFDSMLTSRAAMERVTGVPMPPNRRNGRTRTEHLKRVNALNALARSDGKHLGNPTKEDLVFSYLEEHPEASNSAVARDLGISRPTAIKWAKAYRLAHKESN